MAYRPGEHTGGFFSSLDERRIGAAFSIVFIAFSTILNGGRLPVTPEFVFVRIGCLGMDYRESYHTESTVDSDGKIVVALPFAVGERVEVVVTPHEEKQPELSISEENIPTLSELMAPFIGIADDLPEDLAENHDHYIHGTPKRSK